MLGGSLNALRRYVLNLANILNGQLVEPPSFTRDRLRDICMELRGTNCF